jgi:hypothetical protein
VRLAIREFNHLRDIAEHHCCDQLHNYCDWAKFFCNILAVFMAQSPSQTTPFDGGLLSPVANAGQSHD